MLSGLFAPPLSQSCHLSVLHPVSKCLVQLSQRILGWTGFNSGTCGLGRRDLGMAGSPSRRHLPSPLQPYLQLFPTGGKPSPSCTCFSHTGDFAKLCAQTAGCGCSSKRVSMSCSVCALVSGHVLACLHPCITQGVCISLRLK